MFVTCVNLLDRKEIEAGDEINQLLFFMFSIL